MNSEKLAQYSLIFPKSSQMYNEYLRFYTRGQISDALGYVKRVRSFRAPTEFKKTGKLKASRFLSLCLKLGIDPKDAFEKFDPSVVRRTGRSKFENVDSEERQSVLNSIRDIYDNETQT
jgi:hypothetical protein